MRKLFLLGATSLLLSVSCAYATENAKPASETVDHATSTNKDVWAGRWQQLKGHVKDTWGELTDDDLTQIDGKKDVLLGKLRTKYGYSQDQAEKELAEFEKANQDK
jgi:uncharacterized protein YjbJ (UPF0337 family)